MLFHSEKIDTGDNNNNIDGGLIICWGSLVEIKE